MAEDTKNNANKNTENSNNKKKKFSLENIKKIDLKQIVKGFTFVWGIVLIILMTITNVGINKNFSWIDWVSNALIIFGIMVFGLLMGETSGKDRQMSKVGGLYQVSLKKYEDFNKSITEELIYFNQFYSWLLPQEIYSKKVDYLIALGVDPSKAEKIVKYCSYSDLKDLKEHIFAVKDENGNTITLIRKLEEHEIDPVEDVLKGKVKLNAANASYFLTAFTEAKIDDRMTEEGKTLNKERKFNKFANRTLKIVASLVVSLIWGLLTISDFISGNDSQAWVNLVSRISALFTSFLSGWISSVMDIKLQARILENKFKVLQYFHNCLVKKMFVPKLEEELAQDEYKEYLKKEEEKKKNTIIPEIIDMNKNSAPMLENKEEKEGSKENNSKINDIILL